MQYEAISKTDRPDLSIIIVNWNTKKLLHECLRSVLDNLVTINYEIIVVDNASSDGSAEMVKSKFKSVQLMENTENVGFVKANNQAANLAKGRYFLLLNSDTRLLDNGISDIIKYLDSHSEVGIATGKMLNPNKTFQPPYRRFPNLLGSVFHHTFRRIINLNTFFLKHHRYENLNPTQIHDIDWVTGAYLFIRSDLVKDGKIFDEAIFMYYEDTLLCYQVHKCGYRIVYLPYASIIHYQGMSARQIRTITAYNSFKSSVIYFERIYGKKTADVYARIVKIIWHLLVCGFTLFQVVPFPKFREKTEFFRYLSKQNYQI